MLPNSLPHWCIIGIRSSPNKQVSSPSNTNARTLQHMQSSSPMDPSTLRIPDNEQADQLAKCGAQEEQLSTSIHYQKKTTIIKTALKPRKEMDAYHLLDRPGQVVLARLRSCHNRLNAHMHMKLKIVPSPTCPCGEEDQTTEYVLQICNRHQPERIAQWPSATPLRQKLYGGLEDLKKTTNFITTAGLVV